MWAGERAAWASGAEFVCAPSLDQKIARQLLAALICLGWAHAACCWLRADVFCTSGIARRSKLYTAAAAPAARSLLLCLLVCAVRGTALSFVQSTKVWCGRRCAFAVFIYVQSLFYAVFNGKMELPRRARFCSKLLELLQSTRQQAHTYYTVLY